MQPEIRENTSTKQSWSVIHPLSPEDSAAMTTLRSAVAAMKGKLEGVGARAPFNGIMERVPSPDGIAFEADSVGGISGWWAMPTRARKSAAILHLHGGWFNWGAAQAFRKLVGHIAIAAGADAFIPDYRLAPEHPFPAALKDAEACYRGLIDRGIKKIALTGESFETRAEADLYFVKSQVAGLVRSYLGENDPKNPLASPLYGDLAGLPAVRVHVGDDEVLLDDSRRYVERAVAAGVDAKLDLWMGMPHGFVSGVGNLHAANQALGAIGTFLNDLLE